MSRASAAGVTWTSRTTSAPWAARRYHTSVVDAAGAIYVIGGFGVTGDFWTQNKDVWASTDGGACPDSRRVNRQRGIKVYHRGIRGTRGVSERPKRGNLRVGVV